MGGLTNRSWDTGVIATPRDSGIEPSGPFAAFTVFSAGTVSFIDQAGNTSGASGSIAAGTVIYCKGVRINQTGTSATILLHKSPL